MRTHKVYVDFSDREEGWYPRWLALLNLITFLSLLGVLDKVEFVDINNPIWSKVIWPPVRKIMPFDQRGRNRIVGK